MIDVTRAIADTLLGELGSLIEGNHANASDLVEQSWAGERGRAIATVHWRFVGISTCSNVHYGNNGVCNTHHGTDYAAFKRDIAQLYDRAKTDINLHQRFLTSLKQAGLEGLGWVTQRIEEFGKRSVHYDCTNCGASGECICSACNGSAREQCTYCWGSGRYSETTNSGSRTVWCSYCSGTGKRRCFHCSDGRVRCSSCRGHGYFTEVQGVACVAEVHSRTYQWDGDLQRAVLLQHLVEYGPARFKKIAHIHTIDTAPAEIGRATANYSGHADVGELTFALQGRTMSCVAAGATAQVLVTAPIFDHLFQDELQALESLSSGSGKPLFGSAKARHLFHDYLKQPALERAIRAIGQLTTQERKDPGRAVSSATRSFITKEAADRLGRAIARLLDYVSPAWSAPVWWTARIVLAIAAAAVSAIVISEVDSGSASLLIALPIFLFVLSLVTCLVAWPVSAAITWAQRLTLPTEYRQRGRNREPMGATLGGALLAAVLGVGYGLFADRGMAPMPLPALYQWFLPADTCSVTPANCNLNTLTSALARHANAMAAGNKQRNAFPVSQLFLVQDVQAQLQRLGYSEIQSVDGKLGPRTREAIARYCADNALILPLFLGHPDKRFNIAIQGETDEDQNQDAGQGEPGPVQH